MIIFYCLTSDNLYRFHCANSAFKSDTAGQSVNIYCDLAIASGIDYCQQCLFFRKTEKGYQADLMYKSRNHVIQERAFVLPYDPSVKTGDFIHRTCFAFTKNLRISYAP